MYHFYDLIISQANNTISLLLEVATLLPAEAWKLAIASVASVCIRLFQTLKMSRPNVYGRV